MSKSEIYNLRTQKSDFFTNIAKRTTSKNDIDNDIEDDIKMELTKFGEIATDEEGRTSLPGVFGAGDVTDVPYKQIVVAMGEGSKAGLSAFDYLIRTEPVEDIAQAA